MKSSWCCVETGEGEVGGAEGLLMRRADDIKTRRQRDDTIILEAQLRSGTRIYESSRLFFPFPHKLMMLSIQS